MTSSAQKHLPDLLFAKPKERLHFAVDGFERAEQHWDDSCSQLVDIHSKHGAQIYYLRVTSANVPKKISLSSTATVERALDGSEFSILLRVNYEEVQYTVWLPSASGQFCFDEYQRIAISCGSPLSYQLEFQPYIQLRVLQPARVGEVAVIPYVVLEDPNGQFFEELGSLSDVERRLYRKSNWFFARTPSDIWNYLINGSIYDPRARKGVDKRFKCQQCAYAWWSYFDFLRKETDKKIYAVMQDEIAYAVLLDMSAEGEWGHGFWSDDIETHARFHLDGVHLLISQYEKTNEPVWLEAAERGMAFIAKHLMERLDDGSLWFLHDTIEHNERHHFKSILFGKSPGNSLCINTHIQALTVINRLSAAIPDKRIYAEMFEKGARALHRVLDHQPGEILYRLLMFWIMKYKTRNAHSIWNKLRTRLEDRIIRTIYWPVRRQFPRLVHPGGFTARDLTLSFVSDGYHITNLKDFLTLYEQEPFTWLRPYIENGYEFVRKFLNKLDLTNAVARHPHYIELVDILYLYNKLIEHIPSEQMHSAEKKIYQQTSGYSLDYYASELVRGRWK
jgi:hypothetical protein